MSDPKYFPIHQTEIERCAAWLQANLLDAPVPPFAFIYDGKPSQELMPQWCKEAKRSTLDANRVQYTITYLDPATRLLITCIAVQNTKFPQLEWTVWFKNNGDTATPILEQIRGIDTHIFTEKSGQRQKVVLHHFTGDYYSPDGYMPLDHYFMGAEPVTYSPVGGRPTNREFPYYKLQGSDGGVIFVLSWQGQWETTFTYEEKGVRVIGGQQLTRLSLLPGEEIRTPLVLLMFYDGADEDRSVNMWRRWFIEFNMPRVNGELIKPFYANYSGKFFNEMVNANEANQIAYANLFLDHSIPFDYLWMDAGWYDMQGRANWTYTGTWRPDYTRFPRGLRGISDYVHSKDIKTMVWFEPERIRQGTELWEEHTDMLLPLNPDEATLRNYPSWNDTRLLNLSDPKVVDWMAARLNALIKSEGIDLYRQDFNIDPIEFWRHNDAPDRQGITENHYCTGYLRLWDMILLANPGIIIDSCSSGGRRNDLETLRRALPLHKTDYNYDDLATKQGFHHTLFQWFPFFGSMNWPGDQSDVYYQRSALLMSFHGSENVFEPWFDFEILKKWMQEWRDTAHCLYGDYYPLTPWSRGEFDWIGWQFNLPESGEGMVQMFMRPQTPHESGVFKLKGLEPESRYEIMDYNEDTVCSYTGQELMEEGLTLTLSKRPDSVLLWYMRVNNQEM